VKRKGKKEGKLREYKKKPDLTLLLSASGKEKRGEKKIIYQSPRRRGGLGLLTRGEVAQWP